MAVQEDTASWVQYMYGLHGGTLRVKTIAPAELQSHGSAASSQTLPLLQERVSVQACVDLQHARWAKASHSKCVWANIMRPESTLPYSHASFLHQSLPQAKVLVQVDASALGLHDYHQVIRRPMDLGTIKKSLMADEGAYSTSAEVLKDVQQVWANCRTYNDEDDPIMYVQHDFIHS